jgi:hypothetical protein
VLDAVAQLIAALKALEPKRAMDTDDMAKRGVHGGAFSLAHLQSLTSLCYPKQSVHGSIVLGQCLHTELSLFSRA